MTSLLALILAASFTVDWTTTRLPEWDPYLGPLAGQPDTHGLEIGCYEGRSTLWFINNILTGKGSTLTCVDIFNDPTIEARFDENLGQNAKLIKIKGGSQLVVRQLPDQTYDFVYIDGCHKEWCALTDAINAYQVVKVGGLIIFDDYNLPKWKRTPGGPRLAIDVFLEVFASKLELLHKGTKLVIVRRLGGDW